MNETLLNHAKTKKELRLNLREHFTHFAVVYIFVFLSIPITYALTKKVFLNGIHSLTLFDIFFIAIPIVIAIGFHLLQKKRLKFKEVSTNLSEDEIFKIIKKVANDLDWYIESESTEIVFARTFPCFFSGSWGEQITIIIGENIVLINSICDLKKRSSLVSMGRNKKNENTFIREIEKANRKNSIPSNH